MSCHVFWQNILTSSNDEKKKLQVWVCAVFQLSLKCNHHFSNLSKEIQYPGLFFPSHFHRWILFTLRVAKKRLIPVSFCLCVFYDQEECQKRTRQKERDEIQKCQSEVNNVRNKIKPGNSTQMSSLFHLWACECIPLYGCVPLLRGEQVVKTYLFNDSQRCLVKILTAAQMSKDLCSCSSMLYQIFREFDLAS